MDKNSSVLYMPLMTVAAFSEAMGLEEGVFQAQVHRGYWPTVKIGKRVFVNVEGVRLQAAKNYQDTYPA